LGGWEKRGYIAKRHKKNATAGGAGRRVKFKKENVRGKADQKNSSPGISFFGGKRGCRAGARKPKKSVMSEKKMGRTVKTREKKSPGEKT